MTATGRDPVVQNPQVGSSRSGLPGFAASPDREDLLARAWLTRVFEPGVAEVVDFVERYGAVEAVARIRSGHAPLQVAAVASTRDDVDRAPADLAAAAACGARLVSPGHDEWPAEAVSAMTRAAAFGVEGIAAPLALWVRGGGSLAELSRRAVAVVGSRAATPYGVDQAGGLGFDLGERGWTVVSGGAFGIDAAAHRGALSAGGRTVAVLACGVDRVYPAAHSALFERIAENGVLASEWPPGATPYRHRFLIRNRLIAALSAGTVVIEAAARSGARNTAGFAERLGRAVMAYPGPVTSAMSVGTHNLLREEGSRLVTGAAQVIEEVGSLGADLAPVIRGPDTARDGLTPEQTRTLDALPARGSALAEELARDAGLPMAVVLAALPSLELRGLAEAVAGAWRLVRVRTAR